MKRLVLMRHAKSSWKTDAPTDHHRPLNKRGRKAAPKVGAELRRRGWVPDRVLSSDSARTTETFARMKEALGFEGEAHFSGALYHAGVDEVRVALQSLGEEGATVLVLGHNPGCEEVLEYLCGQMKVLKTGSTALLSIDAPDWPRALEAAGRWTLHDVIYPREL